MTTWIPLVMLTTADKLENHFEIYWVPESKLHEVTRGLCVLPGWHCTFHCNIAEIRIVLLWQRALGMLAVVFVWEAHLHKCVSALDNWVSLLQHLIQNVSNLFGIDLFDSFQVPMP